jgi:hypothetical protein
MMACGGRSGDEHLEALKSLARGPRSALSAEVEQLQKLIDLGLARSEEIVGHPILYAITPAGRRAIACSPARPRRPARRALPRFTVAAMQEAGWRIYRACGECGASALIDLDLAAWRYGAKARLSERTDQCLAPGCGGQISYHRQDFP